MIPDATLSKEATRRRARSKRRLLMIGHSYVVGVNRMLPNEIARLAAEDWEVTIAVPTFFQGDLGPIQAHREPRDVARLEFIPARMTRQPHTFVYGRGLGRLLREPWDLIHAWEEPYVFAGGQIALWAPREVPLVFWTGQSTQKQFPPPFSWIESYCLQRCAAWASRGETGRETLMAKGYGCRPGRTLPLGVDTAAFRPDVAMRSETFQGLDWHAGGPPVIGYAGRFVPEKGLPLLMRVLDRVEGDWRALLIGGGPLESELRAWASRYGDRVKIVTGVPHDRVPAYLNAMDLVCAPSQTSSHWREIFGRMLVEAFACGLPVVASDSGEIPNVVGDAAIVVGEKDEVAWVRAVSALIEDADTRHALGRKALLRARGTFAWSSVAQRHLAFFDDILGRRLSVTADGPMGFVDVPRLSHRADA